MGTILNYLGHGIILNTMGIIFGTLGLMNTLVQALGNYLEIVLDAWESMGIILSTNHF